MKMITQERQEVQKYQERKDVPENYCWELQDIYTNEE